MITQTEVNASFEIGRTRMHDVCELIEDGMLGHAEIAGMLMGSMQAHARRRGFSLSETAVEFAELCVSVDEDDDE